MQATDEKRPSDRADPIDERTGPGDDIVERSESDRVPPERLAPWLFDQQLW